MAKITIEDVANKGLAVTTDETNMSLVIGMLEHALLVYRTHLAEDVKAQMKRSKIKEPKTDVK